VEQNREAAQNPPRVVAPSEEEEDMSGNTERCYFTLYFGLSRNVLQEMQLQTVRYIV
jgi:hypothetical protein